MKPPNAGVFAENPLTISAHEARVLHRLSRERKLPTQINTGGAASRGFRRGVELIREGTLGDVREVHMFFSRGGRNFQSPPQGKQEVPKELNWDCWLAQVRWREYHAEWINRIAWRDTSIGELGNFGPHTANMAFAEFLAVGSLATRFPGEPIEFEPATGQITNHPRAAGHLRYEYRKGYII